MTYLDQTRSLLDHTLLCLADPEASDDPGPAITRLVSGLESIKEGCSPEEWARASEACIRHPLRARLHEEPLTARAFFKPRRYAGDAGIIDLIYRHPWASPLLEATSPFGRRLYEFLSQQGPIPRAIRERRRIAAEAIDQAAARTPRPHVLSVACGHLREAELSRAVQARSLGRLVALDQDGESLAEVERCYGSLGVECAREEVESFLDDSARLSGDFELVYSTGLYDYLDEDVGSRLSARLFERLRPGGRLLVANLLRGGGEVAYTESFMDWHVIYRDEDELRALGSLIPPSHLASVAIVGEPDARVAFVSFERA